MLLTVDGRLTWQNRCSGSSSRGSLPPSPGSESGDGELEAALRERDVEIGQLRDTLERNEAAIFTVYEEKERAWEREVRKLRALYETRLRASQQKALRVEQTLASHTYQVSINIILHYKVNLGMSCTC
jgi:vacuolar-type H+-ATPase subunit I/STV1